MNTLEFTPLRAADVQAIGDLFIEHAAETLNAPAAQAAKLVDWSWFERADRLIAVVVRDAGVPVGYGVAELHRNAVGELEACDADVYLKPAYRRGYVGVRLVRALEEAGRQAGAKRAFVTVLPGRPTERLLPRMGYQVASTVFRIDL